MATHLDSTTNLLSLYRHMVGRSEVPSQFHLWACLSLMAACVADRVWLEKFEGSRLCPNLYTVLLGPSGSGKGVAIDLATNLVKDMPIVNMYRGKVTYAHLLDTLGRQRKLKSGQRVLANPKLYLVTPELSMSVGSGALADEFIKLLTELYTGGDYTFQYGTRVGGNVEVRGHTVNWLGGSTKEWFISALSRDAIEGGALARMILVPGKRRDGVRYTRPEIPHDAAYIREHLRTRLFLLTQQRGPFFLTDEAYQIEDQWYQERPEPSDEALWPTWNRQHDLMLKLAMLFALAEGHDLTIRKAHMVAAKEYAHLADMAVPEIVVLASIPKEHSGFVFLREFIKRAGRIQRSALTIRCAKRGLTASRIDEYIKTLKAEGVIRLVAGPHGATFYEWKGRTLHVPEDANGNGAEIAVDD